MLYQCSISACLFKQSFEVGHSRHFRFGIKGRKNHALLNAIIDKNVLDVLERINRYVSLGTDIKRLTDDLNYIKRHINLPIL